MKFTLQVWRQKNAQVQGQLTVYPVDDISPDMSFLEMLDVLNERLISQGQEPVAFDHDCREGICGMCSLVINGRAHGQLSGSTVCQLHMRHFKDGDTITVEPWRARAFPVVKDLVVDRSSFDRVVEKGGYVSVHTGSAPDGNAILIPRDRAEKSMDAAACIGCGACVAACPNASAMLFVAAKISHLALLPQGAAERDRRVAFMRQTMDAEGFGNCSNHKECEAVCPKEIKFSNIARFNREYLRSCLLSDETDLI